MRSEVGGVRLKATVLDGVFCVRCAGLLTAATVRAIRLWVGPATPVESGAVLMDYRACVIAITDDELQRLARPGLPLSPPMPLAWLVGDEKTAELWRRQVLRLALTGQRRFVSCVPEVALAWASEQARLGRVAAQR